MALQIPAGDTRDDIRYSQCGKNIVIQIIVIIGNQATDKKTHIC